MEKFKIGQKVRVAKANDNENYDSFRNKTLIITHAVTSGNGYDNCMYPQKLMSFKTIDGEDIPFSLYEYELEHI